MNPDDQQSTNKAESAGVTQDETLPIGEVSMFVTLPIGVVFVR